MHSSSIMNTIMHDCTIMNVNICIHVHVITRSFQLRRRPRPRVRACPGLWRCALTPHIEHCMHAMHVCEVRLGVCACCAGQEGLRSEGEGSVFMTQGSVAATTFWVRRRATWRSAACSWPMHARVPRARRAAPSAKLPVSRRSGQRSPCRT